MFSSSRKSTLLALCALAACVALPAGAIAQSPPEEQYKFEQPSAGSAEAPPKGSDSGNDATGGVPAAATDSADEGGLPILLVVLAGTALAGAAIAIMRRQKT